MTSPADTTVRGGTTVPVYKRRRRRIYGGAAVAVAVVVALVVWVVVGTGSSGPSKLPGFTISVSQGTVASPDSIIESQPSLAKLIPAQLHYVPFDAGVTAIAEMESGSVQAISGVGNPPTTEAIGKGAGVSVVMGWGFDDDQLLVPTSITSPGQLAGKSIGVLVGSSEDYELLGYLALEHLTGKVKIVPFPNEPAAWRGRPVRRDRRGVRVRRAGRRPDRAEGLPLAGERRADRQAGRPRPGRDRGRDQRHQIQPGARPGLRVRRASGQPRHDRPGRRPLPRRHGQGPGRYRQPDCRRHQGLPVHPGQPAAVLARVDGERREQPHREGVRADWPVPGQPGRGSAPRRRRRRSRRTSTPRSSRRRWPVPARANTARASAGGVAGLAARRPRHRPLPRARGRHRGHPVGRQDVPPGRRAARSRSPTSTSPSPPGS